MATQNTNQSTINATYVVNPTKGDIKVVVKTAKKEAEKHTTTKPAARFAKNLRYSINGVSGGYTGL